MLRDDFNVRKKGRELIFNAKKLFSCFYHAAFFWGGGGCTLQECTRAALFTLLVFFEQVCRLFYSRFILLLSLFHTDHLVSIILFNYDYLNSTTILLCLCFYSLYYNFVNLIFICNNNNCA